MLQDQWTSVDTYFNEHLIPSDELMDAVLRATDDAGIRAINVAPNQGKMLMLLAQMQGAKNILEVGTLGGYSTIWLARALPKDGHIITLEYEPHHAKVAAENIKRAGFDDRVDIRVGAAVETLPKIADEGHVFDFVFIDANKEDNPTYLDWAIRMSRADGVIIVDNVVRDGEVVDADSQDISVQGTRRMIEMLLNDSRVDATAVQTVGSKGYDGFMLARVVGE